MDVSITFTVQLIVSITSTEQIIDVSITDLNGKLVQSNRFTESQLLELKLKEASGVYLVIIESEEQKAVFRLVLK